MMPTRARFVLVLLAAVGAAARPSLGDGTWQGPNQGAWSDAAHWLGAVPNAAGDAGFISLAPDLPLEILVDLPITLGQLRIDGAGNLKLSQAGPLYFETGEPALPAAIVVEPPANAGINVEVLTDLELALNLSGLDVFIGEQASLHLRGRLLGDLSNVAKQGPGLMFWHGTSPSWHGELNVAGGAVHVFNAGAFGSTEGPTTVRAGGVLRLESGVAMGLERLRLDGGSLIAVGNTALSNTPIELMSTGRIERIGRSDPMTLSGLISGPGGVEFVRGETTITRSNTYDGVTILNNSGVTTQAGTALGSAMGPTIVGPGSRLKIDTFSSEPLEIRGGEVIFGEFDSVVFGGRVTMSHGILQLERQRTFSAPIILDQSPGGGAEEARVKGDFSTFNGGTTGVGDIIFDGISTFGASPLAHQGGVTLRLRETRTNDIILNRINTYTGTTRIGDATIVIDDVRTLGSPGSTVIVERNGELQLNRVPQKDYVVQGGSLIVVPTNEPVSRSLVLDRGTLGGRGTFNGPVTLADTPGGRTDSLIYGGVFNGSISGNGLLSFVRGDGQSPIQLNGDNTYRGFTLVQSGVVNANSATALGSSLEATIVGGAEGTLNVNVATNEPLMVVPGGTINVNAPLARLPIITGAQPLYNRANGLVNVNTPSSNARKTEILFGTLQINADTTLSEVVIRTQGELIVADNAVARFQSPKFEIQDGKLRGRLEQLDRIVKTTSGRAVLGPLPGYDGEILVEAGILEFTDPAAFGTVAGATRLAGNQSASLFIRGRGDIQIAEDIFLNNATGLQYQGGLFIADQESRSTIVKLTGRVDLGDRGSSFTSGSSSMNLDLLGPVSGGSLIKLNSPLTLNLKSDQISLTGTVDVRGGTVYLMDNGTLHTPSHLEVHKQGTLAVINWDQANNDRIGDGVALVLRGGIFGLGGSKTQSVVERIGEVQLQEGFSVLGIAGAHAPGQGIVTHLLVSDFQRNRGTAARVELARASQLHVDRPMELDDGIIPWLLIDQQTESSNYRQRFATYGPDGVVAYQDHVTDLSAAGPHDNARIELERHDAPPIVVDSDLTVNALDAGGARIELEGHTLTVLSGGLIGVNSISNGRVTAGDHSHAELLTTGGQYFADVVDNPHGPVDFVLFAGGASMFGNNTYSGATIVNGATLDLRSETGLPEGRSVELVGSELYFNYYTPDSKHLTFLRLGGNRSLIRGSGRILDIDHAILESGEIWDIALTGDGQIEKTTEGFVSLRLANSPTFSGNVLVRDGILNVGQLGSATFTVEGGTLNYTGANAVTLAGGTASIGGTGSIRVTAPSRIAVGWTNLYVPIEIGMYGEISGSMPLTFFGTSPDSWIFVGGKSPSFSGDVTIDSTTVDIRHENSLGTSEITVGAGGRLRLSPLQGTFENSLLDLPNRVVLDGGAVHGFDSNFQPQRLVGELDVKRDSRIGALEVLGPVTLRDGVILSTIAGQPTLFAGPMVVDGSATIRIGLIAETSPGGNTIADTVRFTGPITSGAPQSRLNFELTGLDRLSLSYNAQQGHSLELLVDGMSVDLLLDEEGNYLSGGGTIVNGATVGGGAAIAPGSSIGTLTFQNRLELSSGSVIDWEIDNATGSPGGPTGWDLIRPLDGIEISAASDDPVVLRVVGLGENGDVGSVAGFDPLAEHFWRFIEVEGMFGFAPDKFFVDASQFLRHNEVAAGAQFMVQAGNTGLFLSYLPGGLPGDYNGNGTVEQADLDLVLLNWGRDASTPPAGWLRDLPNGLIDQDDLDAVLLGWGNSVAPLAATAIPEPATCLLLLGLVVASVIGPVVRRMSGAARLDVRGLIRRAVLRSVLPLSVLVVGATSLPAVETSWQLPGGGAWHVTGNWSNGVPAEAVVAVFDPHPAADALVSLVAPATAGGLRIGTNHSISITGAPLTLAAGPLEESRVELLGAQSQLILPAGVHLLSPVHIVTNSPTAIATIGATIDGEQVVTAAGPGTLRLATGHVESQLRIDGGTLAFAEELTGGTFIRELTLHSGANVQGASPFGGLSFDQLIANSGLIDVPLRGDGSFIKATSGRVVLAQSNLPFVGDISVRGGTLAVGHAGALGDPSAPTIVREGGELEIGNVGDIWEPIVLNGGRLRSNSTHLGPIEVTAPSRIHMGPAFPPDPLRIAGGINGTAKLTIDNLGGNGVFIDAPVDYGGTIRLDGQDDTTIAAPLTLAGNLEFAATARRPGRFYVDAPVVAGRLVLDGGSVIFRTGGSISVPTGVVELRSGGIEFQNSTQASLLRVTSLEKTSVGFVTLTPNVFTDPVSVEVRQGTLNLPPGDGSVTSPVSVVSPHHAALDLSGQYNFDIQLNNATGLNFTGGLRARSQTDVFGDVDLGTSGSYLYAQEGSLRLHGSVTGGALHALGAAGVTLLGPDVRYEGATVVGRNGALGRLDVSAQGALHRTTAIEIHRRSSLVLGGSAHDGGAVGDDIPIAIQGGAIGLIGNPQGGLGERLGVVTVPHGVATFGVTSGEQVASTLTIGEMRRGPQASVSFLGAGVNDRLGTGQANSPRILFETPPPLTGGILGGWAITTTGNDGFNDFATYHPQNGVQALGTAGRRQQVNGAGRSDNVRAGTAALTSPSGDTEINSLMFFRPTSLAEQLLLLRGHRLSIRTGGILSNSWGPVLISGGTLTSDDQSGAPALYLTNNGPQPLVIQADIVDPGEGQPLSLVTSGWGKIRLEGSNRYTGPTVINGIGLTSTSFGYSNSNPEEAIFTRREAIPENNDLVVNGGQVFLDFSATQAVTLRSLTVREGGVVSDLGRNTQLDADSYFFESGTTVLTLVGDSPIIKTTDGEMLIGGFRARHTGPVVVEAGVLAGQLGSGPVTVNGGRFLPSSGNGTAIAHDITLNGGALGLYGPSFDANTVFIGPLTIAGDAELLAFEALYEPPRGTLSPRMQDLRFASDVTLRDGVTVTKVGGGRVEFRDVTHVGSNVTYWNDSGIATISGTVASASSESVLDLAGPGDFDLTRASYHVAADQSLLITRDRLPLTLNVSGVEGIISGPGRLLNPVSVGDMATIAPGASTGILTIEGDVTIDVDGRLEIELFGRSPGESFDVLRVQGLATLAGDLEVLLTNELGQTFLPGRGEAFSILTAEQGVQGTFRNVVLPRDVNGYRMDWDLRYASNGIELSVVDAYLTGDFNGNGQVEQGDLDLVLLNWGVDTAMLPAGWVSDLPVGKIDQAELDKVLLGWGKSVAPALVPAAVPEPATLLVLSAALLAVLPISRCRRLCFGQ